MKNGTDCANSGDDMERDTSRLERIWDEVQALNRAAGPWGIFGAKNGAE